MIEIAAIVLPFAGLLSGNSALYTVGLVGVYPLIFYAISLEQIIMNNIFFLLSEVNSCCCIK